MYSPLIYPDPNTLDKLKAYLREEIDNHNSERTQWVDLLKRYDNIYWAEPSAAASQGPIKFGATIVIPLVATAVEMMQAKEMGKMFALEQFTAITLPDTYADLTRSIGKIMDHELLITADLRSAVENAALEFNKFGPGILKTGYIKDERRKVWYDDEGIKQERFVTVKQGLCIDHVQCANFLMPLTSQDPQSAPWVGEVHFSTPFQFLGLVKNSFLYEDAYELLERYYTQTLTASDSPSNTFLINREQKESRIPLWPKRLDWYEIFLSYDIDNDPDGEKEEIVVYYHRLSDQIIGIRYNDRHDISRPYFHEVYFPLEGRWTGIGLCKMGDQFQTEVTTQHRQRLDAGTLANLRMFKAKKGGNIQVNEPIFYGKIWMVDEMDEIEMFQIGEVYPSAFQNEQATLLHWQQRSKSNEQTLGMPQVGTPGTAAGEMGRLQESTGSIDYTYNRLKNLVRKVSLDAMCIVGQYGVRHEAIYATVNDGDAVRQFLSMDPFLIKDQILLKFDLVGQSQNKLIDRASWTQLAGMITQYYTNMLQIAAQSGDQMLTQTVARKALTAGTEALKQILESFDVRNIERIILTPQELGNGQPAIQNPNLIGGIAGLVQQPGMGFVNPASQIVGGG